jgi:hypothetical protein
MKNLFSRSFAVLAMATIVLAAGCAFFAAPQVKYQNANASTQASVFGHLNSLAAANPSYASAVSSLLANWSTNTDSANYNAASPLLDAAAALTPSDPSVGAVKRTWHDRIASFYPTTNPALNP